jgi:hypothetical protein
MAKLSHLRLKNTFAIINISQLTVVALLSMFSKKRRHGPLLIKVVVSLTTDSRSSLKPPSCGPYSHSSIHLKIELLK